MSGDVLQIDDIDLDENIQTLNKTINIDLPALLDKYKDDPELKLYSVSKRYCILRNQGLDREFAYRIAKGLGIDDKVYLRTLQYHEATYKKLTCDPRKLTEIKLQAAQTYLKILKGLGRKVEKVTKDGDIIEYTEKPPFSVIADLAKDTLEHNHPTIKKTENVNLDIKYSVVDMSKYE